MLSLFLLLAAHDDRFIASEVRVSERELVWTVDVGVVRLQKGVAFPVDPPDLLEEDVLAKRGEIVRYLGTAFSVEVNGKPAALEGGRTEPKRAPLLSTGQMCVAHVKQELVYRGTEPIRSVTLRFLPFKDGMESRSTILVIRGDRRKLYVESEAYALDVDADPSPWKFVGWGMHHIFVGYDHIAFLMALLLAARGMVEMLKVVTSFTVAHSITLLLAALDVVRLAPAITEALIAASIVYVAAENYLVKRAPYRWVLTFLFGLVHGLGFAGVLREKLEMVGSVGLPVVMFNVGVELGQIAILLAAFPVLAALRRSSTAEGAEGRQTWLMRVGSAPIGLFGMGWLLDRLFGWQLMGWMG